VRAPLDPSRQQRQQGLRPIESLHLPSSRRRTTPVVDEERIGGQFERLIPMGLEREGPPSEGK
jgi:hypothetical protein